MKLAVMFSGQGAQRSGMGLEVYENSPHAKEIFERAGEDIKKMCFEGTDEQLSQTMNTQPCLFTVSVAKYEAFLHDGSPDVSAVCGFSLGEYAALVAAEVFSFDEGLWLIKKRAALMNEAAQKNPGGMVAILGLESKAVHDILEQCNEGVLEAVNYNCPGQIVVAGTLAAIEWLVSYCENNAIKCAKLPVSGAFHSSLMAEVVPELSDMIKQIRPRAPKVPVISNVTARPYEHEQITDLLARQVASPVHWEDGIRYLLDVGIQEFVEIGEGNTLKGFLRRIDRNITIV